jgi:hypothetical protein
MGKTEEIFDSDIMPDNLQGVEAVENSKVNERCGNVVENKGPASQAAEQSGNLEKTKVVTL